ncbi:MAG: ABC transporter ATP-binding protein [Acidimicrobiia bacterium]|nr:ABC transporter ATP-binding protein [Acidimicrobiia bacterium]
MSGARVEIDGLGVSYDGARALAGVDLQVEPGQTTAVLGANGAGKSSLAAAIAGVVIPQRGRIRIDGTDVTRWPSHRRSRMGVAYVPEGRGIFPHLTVVDNLRAMLRTAVAPRERSAALDHALEMFPVLGERRRQAAGTLSGGEQQMLSLARVLAAPPRLLIADEMSLGLAPRMVDVVFDALARAKADGVTIVLVEQYVERAIDLADAATLLRHGEVAWSGPFGEALEQVRSGYLT